MTFFPIYDWRFEDLWRYVAERGLAYNRLYDQMYRAGVAHSQMRICQPYGDDQRRGLDLYHRIEPGTWFRVVRRVSGANFAARYSRQKLLGYRGGLGLPPTFSSWRQYSEFLLRSLPVPLQRVYGRRIDRFIAWWGERGYPLARWPDAGLPALENRKKQPSWRRIALSLLEAGYGALPVVRLCPRGCRCADGDGITGGGDMRIECNVLTLRSLDDEAAFFALLGRFFASPGVRRACGGYPLNDGPRYRWFVAQCRRDGRALAFISIEEQPGRRAHPPRLCAARGARARALPGTARAGPGTHRAAAGDGGRAPARGGRRTSSTLRIHRQRHARPLGHPGESAA